MRTLNEQLSMYAAYHRDRRNVATHFVGIPMIVVSVAALLGKPAILIGGFALTPAHLAVVASVAFYLVVDRRFGLAMAAFMGLSLFGGLALAAMPTKAWLTWSIGLFVVGWIFQTIGHVFEGKKPAFMDDLLGFLVGPLFLVAEAAVALGLRDDIRPALAAPEVARG